jgi:hypothetical protein
VVSSGVTVEGRATWGKVLYAGMEQAACHGSDESVWEALGPWQALPGDL